MNADQMIRFFDVLGGILERSSGSTEPFKILLIGGAYMILVVGNRPTTKDVDCIFTTSVLTSPEHDVFIRAVELAIKDVSKDFPCEFTDSFGDHLRSVTQILECNLWLKTGMLEVYVPNDRYILALKLEAGREKDIDDIRALFQREGISTRKEAEQVIASVYTTWMRRGRARQLRNSLDDVFRALDEQN